MIPQHHLPADIERTSMQIIAKELEERRIRIPRENLAVVKRVIHTTADFEYAETLHFTENAVQKAIEALHNGATIITDTINATIASRTLQPKNTANPVPPMIPAAYLVIRFCGSRLMTSRYFSRISFSSGVC